MKNKKNTSQQPLEVISSSESPSNYETMVQNYNDWEDIMSSSVPRNTTVCTQLVLEFADTLNLAPLKCTVTIIGECTPGAPGKRRITNIDRVYSPESSTKSKNGEYAEIKITGVYLAPVGEAEYIEALKKTIQTVNVSWEGTITESTGGKKDSAGKLHPAITPIYGTTGENGLDDPQLVCPD